MICGLRSLDDLWYVGILYDLRHVSRPETRRGTVLHGRRLHLGLAQDDRPELRGPLTEGPDRGPEHLGVRAVRPRRRRSPPGRLGHWRSRIAPSLGSRGRRRSGIEPECGRNGILCGLGRARRLRTGIRPGGRDRIQKLVVPEPISADEVDVARTGATRRPGHVDMLVGLVRCQTESQLPVAVSRARPSGAQAITLWRSTDTAVLLDAGCRDHLCDVMVYFRGCASSSQSALMSFLARNRAGVLPPIGAPWRYAGTVLPTGWTVGRPRRISVLVAEGGV